MADPLQIDVLQHNQLLYSGVLEGPIEFGRQKTPAEACFAPQPRGPSIPGQRLPISSQDLLTVSREHALVERLNESTVRITNISRNNSIGIRDARQLGAGASCEQSLPCGLEISNVRITLDRCPDDLNTLSQSAHAPGARFEDLRSSPLSRQTPEMWDSTQMIEWFQRVTNVLHSAATSAEFLQLAAAAVVDMVGLDSGRVLIYRNGNWSVVAQEINRLLTHERRDWLPSSRVLERMLLDKKTVLVTPSGSSVRQSQQDVQFIVVCPILDRNREVIGALYGDRLLRGGRQHRRDISKLEAMLVGTLATSIAAGLARQEQESAAMAARVKFEQFFSSELSHQLEKQPDLLLGRDAEVTVMFCDIRGFSRVTERLGPARAVEWVSDVLSVLSECVIEQQGVLVDYVGDELLAMWGAPSEQPDHAQRACKAALAMTEALPELSSRWQERVFEPTKIGIGINTGPAFVGNTGSKRKFKYGPLGNTVNLASRVQGATKYLKTNTLITAATQEKLDASMATRRLCQVQVVNIQAPVQLYELRAAPDDAWFEVRAAYEEALEQFEKQELRAAAGILGKIIASKREDVPSLLLFSRAAEMLVAPPTAFSPVWPLPGK